MAPLQRLQNIANHLSGQSQHAAEAPNTREPFTLEQRPIDAPRSLKVEDFEPELE